MATVEYRYGVRSVADGTSYRPANRKGRAGCVCGKCAGVPRCLGRGSSRWELPQEVVAQLRLGHEFKQHLVTIEHEDENAIDAMWRTVPAIAAIASLLDATQEETASLVARARAEHSAGHSTATGRDTATALRAARGRERKLRQDRRDAIEAARPGKTAELTQLAAARKDAITAARRAAAAGGLYWGCADEETEILTSAGWRHHADLDVGDVVLTLNVATRLSEWQPVRAVNRYDARRAPMLTMRSSSHSSVTTLNHRWPLFWTARNGTGRQEWRTSGDLPGQRAILTAAPLADPPSEPKQADALVELVAWFSASGSIDKRAGRGDPRVTIRAASPAQGTRIRWALSRLYGPPAGRRGWDARDPGGTPAWREIPPAAHDQARFRLNRLAAAPLLDAAPGRAVHPGFVRELTAAQLELFVRTAIDASSRRQAWLRDRHRARTPGTPGRRGIRRDPGRVLHLPRGRRPEHQQASCNAGRFPAAEHHPVFRRGLVPDDTQRDVASPPQRNGLLHRQQLRRDTYRTRRLGAARGPPPLNWPACPAEKPRLRRHRHDQRAGAA